MIAYLRGKLVHKEAGVVILDVNGVGYEVRISLHTYTSLKNEENCTLLTHFHVKEDSHTLYGFSHPTEKKLFLELVSVSGVGPGTALVILSSLSVEELQHAIVSEDVKLIQSVKGIGLKTAQRIILELRDKILKMGLLSDVPVSATEKNSSSVKIEEAIGALVTLGIAKIAAEKSVQTIIKRSGSDITVEDIIKQGLKTA